MTSPFGLTLEAIVPADQLKRVPRCAEAFEDFCTVTASIRPAIDVQVVVEPAAV